tara:strand:+ start:2432 stop:2758 length:327 start_codon:yes stop_codon:yes gene_type:complete
MTEKIQIKISDILRMLKEGLTRKELSVHYGVTQTEMKGIFQHPELKGKRTMPKVEATYTLINDVNGDVEVASPTPFEEDNANGTEEEETHNTLAEAEDAPVSDPWNQG